MNISVVGRAYNTRVTYSKLVTDAFAAKDLAVTWHTGSSGTHGGDAGYIMSWLSQHLDKFLAAYLRVNELACESPAGRP